MDAPVVVIRPYRDHDHAAVRDLFVRVNRELAPAHLAAAFEAYIARSLEEEIDRIPAYYAARNGGFWVAESRGRIVGMFGLEAAGERAAELRRMYVAPEARRLGMGRAMLAEAERQASASGCVLMVLSTSELQPSAIALYRASGYTLVREEVASAQSNKTVGGGLRRFHFRKEIRAE